MAKFLNVDCNVSFANYGTIKQRLSKIYFSVIECVLHTLWFKAEVTDGVAFKLPGHCGRKRIQKLADFMPGFVYFLFFIIKLFKCHVSY